MSKQPPATLQSLLKLLLLTTLIAFFSASHAESFVDIKRQLHKPIPGGVAVVALGASPSKPEVTLDGQQVYVIKDNQQNWWAIVGISLDKKPGELSLEIKGKDPSNRRISFEVKSHQYKSQHITLKNKAMVTPPPKTLERIAKELEQQIQAYKTFSSTPPSNIIFAPPVQGRLSSPFGLQRYFNGQARNPHSGLDFAAPKGTPVKAPASGKILLVADLYFNGLTVFIDHGQGLITMYCHLSSSNHLPGDQVKRGEIIGEVGSTGRATGPHLHWNVSLNNARVDPAIFLTK